MIIDSHVHLVPDKIGEALPPAGRLLLTTGRQKMQGWMSPWTSALHQTQKYLRLLPRPIRKRIDSFAALGLAPGLLVEATPQDLLYQMEKTGVAFSLVIAHPPFLTNEFVFEIASENPKLLPVVNIPAGTSQAGDLLRDYAARGAKALKIHPASDGEGVDSPRYRALLQAASELGLPVIIHTGCVHSHVIYKEPELGQAQKFSAWFEAFPEVQFILAHMNMHEPTIALDLCEAYPNLWVETSWQPTEVIAEAVRRIGASRVLFGTDWPFIGNNQRVGLERIHEAVDAGLMSEDDARLIRGKNAAKLFKVGE
jgi:predicted TIM-barrel fold metal-dependent hydrolase